MKKIRGLYIFCVAHFSFFSMGYISGSFKGIKLKFCTNVITSFGILLFGWDINNVKVRTNGIKASLSINVLKFENKKINSF